ncbi:hypothetical protein [Acidovorax sp. Root267]|uniref:hypothetical protein n=1 Tax=Acidovorax sp. Root267 TaxID=1736505 RepID=UPI001124D42E|nr:hypothetical protein [Acidovorax sp. Root267]
MKKRFPCQADPLPQRGTSAFHSTAWRLCIPACAAFVHQGVGAHVKWFVPFDLQQRPRDPLAVFTSHEFVLMAACILPLMYCIFWADQRLSNSAFWRAMGATGLLDRWAALSGRMVRIAPDFLRIGLSVFFFALCLYGDVLLTPELKTDLPHVRWMQGTMAVLLLARRSAWLGALGIPVLYALAIAKYGIFHLLDYPIFLGIAAYLFLWSWFGVSMAALADGLLRGLTAITLLWASIEKWGYPEWSFGLLAQRPELAFGFGPEFYMVAAGFVEFSTAYLLVTGRVAGRGASVVLLFFFVSAIIPFGMIDAVGHSGIILVLVVLALGGPNRWAPVGGVAASHGAALRKVLVFACVLATLGAAYSGLHRLAYDFPVIGDRICLVRGSLDAYSPGPADRHASA